MWRSPEKWVPTRSWETTWTERGQLDPVLPISIIPSGSEESVCKRQPFKKRHWRAPAIVCLPYRSLWRHQLPVEREGRAGCGRKAKLSFSCDRSSTRLQRVCVPDVTMKRHPRRPPTTIQREAAPVSYVNAALRTTQLNGSFDGRLTIEEAKSCWRQQGTAEQKIQSKKEILCCSLSPETLRRGFSIWWRDSHDGG